MIASVFPFSHDKNKRATALKFAQKVGLGMEFQKTNARIRIRILEI